MVENTFRSLHYRCLILCFWTYFWGCHFSLHSFSLDISATPSERRSTSWTRQKWIVKHWNILLWEHLVTAGAHSKSLLPWLTCVTNSPCIVRLFLCQYWLPVYSIESKLKFIDMKLSHVEWLDEAVKQKFHIRYNQCGTFQEFCATFSQIENTFCTLAGQCQATWLKDLENTEETNNNYFPKVQAYSSVNLIWYITPTGEFWGFISLTFRSKI